MGSSNGIRNLTLQRLPGMLFLGTRDGQVDNIGFLTDLCYTLTHVLFGLQETYSESGKTNENHNLQASIVGDTSISVLLLCSRKNEGSRQADHKSFIPSSRLA